MILFGKKIYEAGLITIILYIKFKMSQINKKYFIHLK